ncbi:MAG: cysteine hydrolase family protein [Bacteroidales bacterium]
MSQAVYSGPTALILIDIQDFYFPGGRLQLTGAEDAEKKAVALLSWCRDHNFIIVHVMHKGGGDIRKSLAPGQGEKLIVKSEINSFKGTDLADFLHEKAVKKLVLAGMQTNMCLEAATRAASDLGFSCTVIHDACAARDLEFNGTIVKAKDVHLASLVTLKTYALIQSLEEFTGNNHE